MKTIFSLVLILLTTLGSVHLYSQGVELFTGYTYNMFYDTKDVGGHYQASYINDNGFSGGIGIDSIMLDKLKCRLSLQFDKYNGALSARDGGQAGGYSTNAQVSKSMLSLGIFPLTFDIKKRLHIDIGLLISKMIKETVSGTTYKLLMNNNTINEIEDVYNPYSASVTLGLQGRVAYDIPLRKLICITPQYTFHYGLTNEFAFFPTHTRLMKHYFGIGIKKHF